MRKFFPVAVLCLLVLFVAMPADARRVDPGTEDEMRERLAPFGRVCLEGEDCGEARAAPAAVAAPAAEPEAAAGRSGQEVYERYCFVCHTTGAAAAPRLGDAESWAPRVEAGMDAMLENTINGIGVMPPRGTCMDCSDAEVEASIRYILDTL